MKLVHNTTDILDHYIEEMLRELEQPDNLPVAVKVKNSWKRRDFHGTFYPDASSRFLMSPKGVKYVLGANDKGYDYRDLITLHVPPFPWPMLLDTNEKVILKLPIREDWGIEVPNRFIGLKIIAAHEVQHARLREKVSWQSEMLCDIVMIELARKLNLKIAPWEEMLREAEELEERERMGFSPRDSLVPSQRQHSDERAGRAVL